MMLTNQRVKTGIILGQLIELENIELLHGGDIRIKKIPIWKAKKSFFDIYCIKNIDTIEDALNYVKINIRKIESIITWVEESRIKIGKFLIQIGEKDRAEDWMAQVDNYDEITDESFIDSLDIGDICIDYEKSSSMDEFHLEITFDPDYFNGHRSYVGVTAERQLFEFDL